MSISTGSVCLLSPLGVIAIRGPAARAFLQGQLSNDLGRLDSQAGAGDRPRALLRAGLHNPQGRTLALLGLVGEAEDALLAVLPRELISVTLATLRRYVLRAKVSLTDESEAWQLHGLTASWPSTSAGRPVIYEGARSLLLTPVGEAAPAGEPLSYEGWHALDIAAGLPQVYAASSGQLVAQMLNLDCIDAISFTKGCYTGQEVIARAHYRGRIKRRMQRYLSRAPLRLAPGDRGELLEGGAFVVVDSTSRADGCCEFLAVAALPQESARPADALEPDAAAAAGSADAGREPVPRVDAQRLPLPYSLPQ